MTDLLPASAPDAIERAADALRRGELIAIPTETVYGLAVLPADGPLGRLLEAKRRSAEKGIQLLVDSIDQARDLAILHAAAERLADAFWPGPLTLVLPRRPDVELPELLGGGRATLGFRLPDHDVPRSLARLVGPIAASSANITGRPDALTARDVIRALGQAVALVLDDGPARGGVPSTVVDCSSADGIVRILRAGALSEAEILAAVG